MSKTQSTDMKIWEKLDGGVILQGFDSSYKNGGIIYHHYYFLKQMRKKYRKSQGKKSF